MIPTREELRFALALEKPTEKRPAFLDARCEDDPALRDCRDQTAFSSPCTRAIANVP